MGLSTPFFPPWVWSLFFHLAQNQRPFFFSIIHFLQKDEMICVYDHTILVSPCEISSWSSSHRSIRKLLFSSRAALSFPRCSSHVPLPHSFIRFLLIKSKQLGCRSRLEVLTWSARFQILSDTTAPNLKLWMLKDCLPSMLQVKFGWREWWDLKLVC